MQTKDLENVEVGTFVTYELDRVTYQLIDVDENGFTTNDNVYHCGDSLENFDIGIGWRGNEPIFYYTSR